MDEIQCSDDIAAVTSKVLFLRPFVPVRLTEEARAGGSGGRTDESAPAELLIDERSGFESCGYRKLIVTGEGGSSFERPGQRGVRLPAGAELLLPVDDRADDTVLRLRVARPGGPVPVTLVVAVGETPVARVVVGSEFEEHRLPVPAAALSSCVRDVINNAGSRLDDRGNAGDRGIWQPDRGQYERAEDVEAICGAAVLLRGSALERVGRFDRDFFMYYEDTDLSWRLRAAGYRLRYRPSAVVRHHHAATSREWSPLFIYYTSRNRILMIAKNATAWSFLRTYAGEIRSFLGQLKYLIPGRAGEAVGARRAQLRIRLRMHLSLLLQIPRALGKRAGLLSH